MEVDHRICLPTTLNFGRHTPTLGIYKPLIMYCSLDALPLIKIVFNACIYCTLGSTGRHSTALRLHGTTSEIPSQVSDLIVLTRFASFHSRSSCSLKTHNHDSWQAMVFLHRSVCPAVCIMFRTFPLNDNHQGEMTRFEFAYSCKP